MECPQQLHSRECPRECPQPLYNTCILWNVHNSYILVQCIYSWTLRLGLHFRFSGLDASFHESIPLFLDCFGLRQQGKQESQSKECTNRGCVFLTWRYCTLLIGDIQYKGKLSQTTNSWGRITMAHALCQHKTNLICTQETIDSCKLDRVMLFVWCSDIVHTLLCYISLIFIPYTALHCTLYMWRTATCIDTWVESQSTAV